MDQENEIVGAKMLPENISKDEYDDFVASYSRLGYKSVLTNAYKINKDSSSYELSIPDSQEDCLKLWEIYSAINREKWSNYATARLIAQFIYEHRIRCGRIGNPFDDYIKAEYLIVLVNFLNEKHSHVIRRRQDEEMEEIIDEVNNVFDSAYFKKKNSPWISDMECFYQAEREYCKEKEIDFFVYQLHHDYDKAQRILRHKEIETLAQQQYQWRVVTGEPGDEKSDWEMAVSQYPTWLVKKRIATICWNLSGNKHKHQDYYWGLASNVINLLEERGINYIDEDPYKESIHNTIVEIVNGNEVSLQ